MRSIALLILVVTTAVPFARSVEDLSRIVVPDEKDAALKAIKDWLTARGSDVEIRKEVLVKRTGGVLMNLSPIVYKKDLDRLRVTSYYMPKDAHKGTKELRELATKLNSAQNFAQVYIDSDGDLGVGSNLTFYDELTARHFDAFMDLHAQIVKKYILTEEALKMLK